MALEHGPHPGARRSIRYFPVWVLALALSSCHGSAPGGRGRNAPPGAASPPASAVLAEFDDRTLTVQDFEKRLARLPPQLRARYDGAVKRKGLLGDMVRLEVLADEARRRGIDRLPEVRVRIDELIVEKMTDSLFGAVDPKSISDEDVQRYYDSHAGEFHQPEERRAREVVLDDPSKAEAVLRQAVARSHDEAFFEKLARKQNVDPAVGARGGDVGFFSGISLERPPDAVRDAVFALHKPGDVHPSVVADDGHFYVVMLTGIRPALTRDVHDAGTLIRARIAEERRRQGIDDFTRTAMTKAHVRLHPELLDSAPAVPAAAASSAARTE